MDSDKEILRGRPYGGRPYGGRPYGGRPYGGGPYGGTTILYKKHLAKYVTSIPCQDKRISAVKVVMENNSSYVLLTVYLPSDNFCNIFNQSYAAKINVMEHIFNTVSCNAFIICGVFNTSFSRDNTQTTHLSDFMHRNNLTCTWGHSNSKPDFTYNNLTLNHNLCIDHFIVSRNVYDNIHLNHVICDPTNLSNHNLIELIIFKYLLTRLILHVMILLSNQITVIGVKLLKT